MILIKLNRNQKNKDQIWKKKNNRVKLEKPVILIKEWGTNLKDKIKK